MNWLTGNKKAKQIEKLQSDSSRIKNEIKDALLDFKLGYEADLLKLAQEAKNFNDRVREYKSNDKTYDNSFWDHLRIDDNTIVRIINLSTSQIASGKRRKSSKRRKASSKKHKRKMTNRRKKRQTKKSRKKLGGAVSKTAEALRVLSIDDYINGTGSWRQAKWESHFAYLVSQGCIESGYTLKDVVTEILQYINDTDRTKKISAAYEKVTGEPFSE